MLERSGLDSDRLVNEILFEQGGYVCWEMLTNYAKSIAMLFEAFCWKTAPAKRVLPIANGSTRGASPRAMLATDDQGTPKPI